MRTLVTLCAASLIAGCGESAEAKNQKAMADMKRILAAAEEYRAKYGEYPDRLDRLAGDNDLSRPPLLRREDVIDPWGKDYWYTPKGKDGKRPGVKTLCGYGADMNPTQPTPIELNYP